MKSVMVLVFALCALGAKLEPQVREVVIQGYVGTAMEPFVSRDGRYLLFNNSNDPAVNTDLLYAVRTDDFHFVFKGPVQGVNTPALEGTPTMDRQGQLFFVSTRSYAQTSCTIYSAQFSEGKVHGIELEDSICRHQPGVVNFDVDVDASGTTMTFVDSQFNTSGQPQSAQLVLAQRKGTRFVRLENSAALLARVNTGTLQYAPALSSDHLTLWFTRLESPGKFPQIWRASRNSPTQAFGVPLRLEGLGDFIEAPALSTDEKRLYFHRRVGSSFHIFAVPVIR